MIYNGHPHRVTPASKRQRSRIALVAASTALLCGGAALPASSAVWAPAQPAAAAALASSSSSGNQSPPLPTSLTRQQLDWQSCPAPTSLQSPGGSAPGALPDGTPWECATLKVPLDYSDPDGKTIDLALIRAKARPQDGEERIGSLVFNFGGPGGSGVADLPQLSAQYAELHGRYDLVSFDPRGVGASAPVRCLDDKDTETLSQFDGTPETDKEAQDLLALSNKYLPACEQNSGEILPHVGTIDAARDMDLLRQVLGDDKLNYFGISYGTELGGVYAHLFPEHVGRAVFDAVVDPTEDDAQQLLDQTKGFQLALDNYLKDCVAQPDCPVGNSVEEGRKEIVELLNRIGEHPLPTSDGRQITRDLAETGIMAAMYSEEYWPYLTRALQEVQQNNTADTLLRIADSYVGRDPNGHYTNTGDAFRAIHCADSSERYTEADVEAMLPEFRAASPVFGEDMAVGLMSCTDWPVDGESRTPDVSAEGAGPILLVGNTGDPATPYAGTERMAEELGEGVAVELTNKGEGHGAYGTDDCVTKTVNAYLLEGEVPEDGTVCE
ncbi:alpha/beta fold hydrolase [Streptomyces actinomycinicus]|uniref:Alpha/beta fold hydrolase n=1 Tax=Streptomyces actinomycinicus TaxID=1695166 RepID=A0A937JSP5_9ACTN|nr:alpha/beta hydrolase [Streptomyces actinomycinicus]MBL1086967.1 alpha/beta fold hydrolase [Streptomyces actinomycinicus]